MGCIDKFKAGKTKQVLSLPKAIQRLANLSMDIRDMTSKVKFVIKEYTKDFYGRLGIIRHRFYKFYLIKSCFTIIIKVQKTGASKGNCLCMVNQCFGHRVG